MFFILGLLFWDVSRYGWKATLKLILCDIVFILILMGIGQHEINKEKEEWQDEEIQEEVNYKLYGDDYDLYDDDYDYDDTDYDY